MISHSFRDGPSRLFFRQDGSEDAQSSSSQSGQNSGISIPTLSVSGSSTVATVASSTTNGSKSLSVSSSSSVTEPHTSSSRAFSASVSSFSSLRPNITSTSSSLSEKSSAPSSFSSFSPPSAPITLSTSSRVQTSRMSSSVSDTIIVTAPLISASTSSAAAFAITVTPESITTTASASASSSPSSASDDLATVGSESFWSQKSVVAGTFTAVALVGLIGLAVIIMLYIKRRQKARLASENEPFYAEHFAPTPHGHTSLVEKEPTPSTNSSTDYDHAPMDPYATREVFYSDNFDDTAFYERDGNQLSSRSHPVFANTQTNVYLPSVTITPVRGSPTPAGINQAGVGVGLPSDTNFGPVAQRTSPPMPGSLPFPARHYDSPVLRDSASYYQPSIDSFYGASAQ